MELLKDKMYTWDEGNYHIYKVAATYLQTEYDEYQWKFQQEW